MPRSSPQTDRVMAIVNLLTERSEHGATLSEIAAALGQTPATYVHVLAALAAGGFVVRQPSGRRYHLGPALIAPGQVAAGRFPTRGAARQTIEELARELGYPVLVFNRDGEHARLVDAVSAIGRPAPSIRIGDMLPIAPPLGSVFVAWSGPAEIESWLNRGPASSSTRDVLSRRLHASRRRGWVTELRPPLPLLHELLRLTGRGQQLRRAERLPQSIAGLESYIAGPIKHHAIYEVSTLSVPVIAPDGTVALALNLFGFDEPIAGHEVLRLGRVSLVAAQQLARQLDAPER